jgi:hypothetical protein
MTTGQKSKSRFHQEFEELKAKYREESADLHLVRFVDDEGGAVAAFGNETYQCRAVGDEVVCKWVPIYE